MKPILIILILAGASCTPGGHLDPVAAAELLRLAREAHDTGHYISREK